MSYAQVLAAIDAQRFDEAESLLNGLLAGEPDNPALHYEMARVLSETERVAEAIPHAERVADLDPANPRHRVRLAVLYLRTGDFVRGWPAYEARIGLPEYFAERLPLPLWAGEPLAGKTILVWREQGYGDQIMAARFLPLLQGQGAKVIVAASARLTPLYRQLGVELLELPVGFDPGKDPVRLPKADFYTHPLSIPRWLRLDAFSAPSAPYLKGGPASAGPARVGMAWRGNPNHANDRHRSLSPEAASQLHRALGAVVLEPEATRAQDFQATADIIAGLDAVVSVDTAIGHLAGAMGKPTFLLLPAVGVDWRWALSEKTTPWYPTMHLIRQRRPHHWAPVIEEALAQLRSVAP